MRKQTTKGRGDAAVARVIAELTERNFIVLEPRADNTPYDLVVDTEGKFIRIQVRRAFLARGNPVVSLRKVYTRRDGFVVRNYDASQIDFIIAVWNKDCFIFPISEISRFKNAIALRGREKNREAWNLLF